MLQFYDYHREGLRLKQGRDGTLSARKTQLSERDAILKCKRTAIQRFLNKDKSPADPWRGKWVHSGPVFSVSE
jgi:hypothetical protein